MTRKSFAGYVHMFSGLVIVLGITLDWFVVAEPGFYYIVGFMLIGFGNVLMFMPGRAK